MSTLYICVHFNQQPYYRLHKINRKTLPLPLYYLHTLQHQNNLKFGIKVFFYFILAWIFILIIIYIYLIGVT